MLKDSPVFRISYFPTLSSIKMNTNEKSNRFRPIHTCTTHSWTMPDGSQPCLRRIRRNL